MRQRGLATQENPAAARDEVAEAVAAIGPYEPPRAPTEEEWARLSEEERQRIVDALPGGLTAAEIEALPPEGDWHWNAKFEAWDTLRRYFDRLGRRIYLATERRVYYPGQRSFVPDVLAVLDVDPRKRTKWVVSAEGKGLDWVLEVLYHGDRRKDTEANVGFYAELRIPEYFIYDCGQQLLWGHRLPGPWAQRYEPIVPVRGRLASAVLGLDLVVENDQLRFYHGTAELPTSAGLIQHLENLVAEVQAKRTAAEEQRRQSLTRAILTMLEVRGLPAPDHVREQILSCPDAGILERWLDRAVHCTTAEAVVDR
jgi:Uma2 family endonuclease